jgi:hypothetical protein
MVKLKATHFEQVPLGVVKKILAEQSKQEKTTERAGVNKTESDENPLAASTANRSGEDS